MCEKNEKRTELIIIFDIFHLKQTNIKNYIIRVKFQKKLQFSCKTSLFLM